MGGAVFNNWLGMKNMELMGTERLLESVLREYATKSRLDEMESFLNEIPEPKLSLLIEAMLPEERARFKSWSEDAANLDAFKAGPSQEIDRMKEAGTYTPYEMINRFEALQAEVDRQIMKYELWLTANPIARPQTARFFEPVS